MEQIDQVISGHKVIKSNKGPSALFSLSLSGTSAQRWPHFISVNISTVLTLVLSLHKTHTHTHTNTHTHTHTLTTTVLFKSLGPKLHDYRAEIELCTFAWQNYIFCYIGWQKQNLCALTKTEYTDAFILPEHKAVFRWVLIHKSQPIVESGTRAQLSFNGCRNTLKHLSVNTCAHSNTNYRRTT